jgi:hypothetical protein
MILFGNWNTCLSGVLPVAGVAGSSGNKAGPRPIGRLTRNSPSVPREKSATFSKSASFRQNQEFPYLIWNLGLEGI